MEAKKIKKENYHLVTNNSSNKNVNIENNRNIEIPFEY
jgi:hypothetical protein